MRSYDIVYCGSDYVASRLASSISSILKNVQTDNVINFHILDFNISKDRKDDFRALVKQYNRKDGVFVDKNMKNMLTQWGGGVAYK